MVSRSESRRIRALAHRRGRERENRFLVEGVRGVEEVLDANIVLDLAVVSSSLEDTKRGRRLRGRLARGVEVREVGDSELAELSDTTTSQGVLVVARVPEHRIESLLTGGRAVVLVLDGVQDPGNLGTLARSAAAFGCGGLVALPGTVDPWNPKAVRAAAGALFRFPVVQPALAELGEWRRDGGVMLVGADASGEPVGEVVERLPDRVALVLGNEGAGLSPEVEAACDVRLAIPMGNRTESLNVAVAGSILLYALTQERG